MAIDVVPAMARLCLERSPRPGEPTVISGPSHSDRDERCRD